MPKPRLIAVTRIRSEDDIVEAFVRHHAALVDSHVFLDNASNDRTPEILRALQAEGLPLFIHSSSAATIAEAAQNTLLLRRATELGADWIIHLDTDEFIDPSLLGGSLHDALATVPEQAPCAHMGAVNYHPTAVDDAAELVVPLRQRWCDPSEGPFVKVCVRALTARRGATTGDGNHEAYLNGQPIPAFRVPQLRFGHYYMRNGWQIVAKACVGMMRILASGRATIEKNTGIHYTHVFENLRDHPEWLLDDARFMQGNRPVSFYSPPLVENPLAYLGGALRYAQAADPRLKAVSSIIACAETIARRHGELADATDVTRQMVDRWGAEFSVPGDVTISLP